MVNDMPRSNGNGNTPSKTIDNFTAIHEHLFADKDDLRKEEIQVESLSYKIYNLIKAMNLTEVDLLGADLEDIKQLLDEKHEFLVKEHSELVSLQLNDEMLRTRLSAQIDVINQDIANLAYKIAHPSTGPIAIIKRTTSHALSSKPSKKNKLERLNKEKASLEAKLAQSYDAVFVVKRRIETLEIAGASLEAVYKLKQLIIEREEKIKHLKMEINSLTATLAQKTNLEIEMNSLCDQLDNQSFIPSNQNKLTRKLSHFLRQVLTPVCPDYEKLCADLIEMQQNIIKIKPTDSFNQNLVRALNLFKKHCELNPSENHQSVIILVDSILNKASNPVTPKQAIKKSLVTLKGEGVAGSQKNDTYQP